MTHIVKIIQITDNQELIGTHHPVFSNVVYANSPAVGTFFYVPSWDSSRLREDLRDFVMSYITCNDSTIYASPACRNEQERAIWDSLKRRVSWNQEDDRIQIPIMSSCIMVILREINNNIPLAMKELTCL